MDDYLDALNKLLGNDSEINDLMSKYDAIEQAVSNAEKKDGPPKPVFEAEKPEPELEVPNLDEFKEVQTSKEEEPAPVVEESVPEAPKQVEEPAPAVEESLPKEPEQVEDAAPAVEEPTVEEPAPAASEKTEEPVAAFKDPTPDDDDFREVIPEKKEEDFREVSAEEELQQFFEDAKKAVMLDPQEPVIPEIDIDKNGTGLVLAGGGGKGIYQVGMLKVLSEAGVLDDIVAISGVSIGAVNAVLYAMGIDKMEKVWDEIDMGTLFDFDEKQIAAGNTHFSRTEMNNLIDKYMDFNQIRNEKRIIYVGTSKCAANYSGIDPTYGCTAEYFLLNNALDEDINNYLLASTALPYIYSPVPIRGNKYLDGGINDNIPIKPLYDLGIRRFIVIELTPDSKFDKTKFPDAEFISIVPSHDLGDLFTGTLNFENKDKRFKKELGERDGRIYVKTKFEKDETYIAIERAMLEMEYKNIVNENAHQEIQNKLESSVNGNLDKFTSIASKYGIDDIL